MISSSASKIGAVARPTLVDWPINYADLEPYYTKVEWEVGVSGLAGASPFDPPRSKPYPHAAAAGEVLRSNLRTGGAQTRLESLSRADGDSVAAAGRTQRLHELRFLPGLWLRGGREISSLASMIPLAENTGRCEIRPNSYVHKIEMDARGRATGASISTKIKTLTCRRPKR